MNHECSGTERFAKKNPWDLLEIKRGILHFRRDDGMRPGDDYFTTQARNGSSSFSIRITHCPFCGARLEAQRKRKKR